MRIVDSSDTLYYITGKQLIRGYNRTLYIGNNISVHCTPRNTPLICNKIGVGNDKVI